MMNMIFGLKPPPRQTKLSYPIANQLEEICHRIHIVYRTLRTIHTLSLVWFIWMLQMAVNHDCGNLSALPAEVKKLQQMSEKLFMQLQHNDSERKVGIDDIEPRNGIAKKDNAMSMSPDSSGRQQKHPVSDEICGVQGKSLNNTSSTEMQNEVHTFVNPLDYSIHSRQADSTNRSSAHISPVMKSGSSGTSNIGSFSPSSSPSPSLPDSGTGQFAPHRQHVAWKSTKPFGAFLSHMRKSASATGDYNSLPGSVEIFSEIRTKRRGRLKKEYAEAKISNSVLNDVDGTRLPSTGLGPVVKRTECLKPTVKRHLSSGLSGSGNNRTPASTAAYKYLTWREKDRRRRFREEWKHLWLVIPHGRFEVMCLICHKVMTQRKLDTIKRHTVRRHVELLGMAEAERKNLFDQLIRQHSILGSSEAGQTTTLTGLRMGRKVAESTRSNATKRTDYVAPANAEGSQSCHLPRARTTEMPTWYPACLDPTKTLPTASNDPNPKVSSPLNFGRTKDVPENLSHSLTGSFSSVRMGTLLPQMTPTFLPGCANYSYSPTGSVSSKENGGICSPTGDKMGKARMNDHTASSTQKVERPANLNQSRDPALPDPSSLCYPLHLQAPQQANRISHQSDRHIGNLPRVSPLSMTFLQILEQLAVSRNRMLSGRSEAPSYLAETPVSQCSVPFLPTFPPNPSPGYHLHSPVGMRSKNRPTSSLGSRVPSQALNPSFKYSKRNNGHDPAAGYGVAPPQAESVRGAGCGPDLSNFRASDQTVGDHTALTGAVTGTANSELRLSSAYGAPSSYPKPTNEPIPPFFTPDLLMQNWKQGTSSILPAGNSYRSENLGAIQSGPSAHPAQPLTSAVPPSSMSQSPVGTWNNQTNENFGVTNDRKRTPTTNFEYPYIKHPTAFRNQMSTNPEFSKHFDFPHLSQPWSSNTFTYPQTVPMYFNKPHMSEQSKDPNNSSNPSQPTQTPQKHSHGNQTHATAMDSQSRRQSGEYQTVPTQSFSIADCPVCHWTDNQNDGNLREADMKLAEQVSTPHLCPSPHSIASTGSKDRRRAHQDVVNKSTWKGGVERIPDIHDSRLFNRIPNLRPQTCDYIDKPDIRSSFPFWPPSFRSQSTIYPQLPCMLDPTLMLYYSELLRQYAATNPLGGSEANCMNTGSLGNCNTEVSVQRSSSSLKCGAETKPLPVKEELDTTTDNSQSSSKRTALQESDCVSEQLNLSPVTTLTRSQGRPSPEARTPSAHQNSMTSSVDTGVAEGRVKVMDEAGSPVQCSTAFSPIWAVDLSGSTANPSEMLSYGPETSILKCASMAERGNYPLVVHMLRLGPKQDLRECLSHYIVQNHLTGAFVVTCCGSLERARLRLANLQEKEFQGPFEIVSLVGTLAGDGQPHLHVALADIEGQVVGGHLLGQAPVYTTAELVLGITGTETIHVDEHSASERTPSCESIHHPAEPATSKRFRPDDNLQHPVRHANGVRLMRSFDDATGFKELTFRRLSNEHS